MTRKGRSFILRRARRPRFRYRRFRASDQTDVDFRKLDARFRDRCLLCLPGAWICGGTNQEFSRQQRAPRDSTESPEQWSARSTPIRSTERGSRWQMRRTRRSPNPSSRRKTASSRSKTFQLESIRSPVRNAGSSLRLTISTIDSRRQSSREQDLIPKRWC